MSSQSQNQGSEPRSRQALPPQTGAGSAPAAAVSTDRRRLLKGVATGSVLMTVANRPAMGAWCTPSAWVSGNLSQPDKLRKTCGGRSPGFWRTRVERWPSKYSTGTCATQTQGPCSSYNADGTPFHITVINAEGKRGVFFGSSFGTRTLMQVLWLEGSGDPHRLGMHIVAALLNAATIPDYGMSENMVREIWRQVSTQGFYQPSVGDPMYPADVVMFIQNTFE